MEPHGVAGRVVQDEVQEIEMQDGVQADGEIAEESGEVTMLQDGLGDVKQ